MSITVKEFKQGYAVFDGREVITRTATLEDAEEYAQRLTEGTAGLGAGRRSQPRAPRKAAE